MSKSESRVYNSTKNVSYGLIVTVVNTLLSFVTRTIFVKTLGASILSINGLFTEVVSMMSLAELGVGMAIIYNLYKPLAEKDEEKISKLMGLYRKAYNIIAVVIMAVGLVILPFVHLLLTDVEFSLDYVRIVFFLFVVKTAVSYLFSYKVSLLNADQKQYIPSLINMLVQVVYTVVVSVVLFVTHNFILYLVLLILSTLVTNLIVSVYVDKKYPYINYSKSLDKEERKQVFSNIKNIFIKRVSWQITSSTDNMLISTLVSTLQVGYYSNYNMIFRVVRTIRAQITSGITASIGNLSATTDSSKCIEVLRKLTFIYYCIAVVISAGLILVCDQFIVIWLGNDYLMERSVVYICIINLFIEITSDPIWQYLEVSGLFKMDRNIAILGSGVNLIVSFVLGIKIGIAGIFIGTICSVVIQMCLKAVVLFKYKFKESIRSYVIMWIKVLLSFASTFVVCAFLERAIVLNNIYVEFLLQGIVAVIVSGIAILLFFYKTPEFNYTMDLMNGFVRKFTRRGKHA